MSAATIWFNIRIKILRWWYLKNVTITPDRKWLETKIFYEIIKKKPANILFIGTEWYTAWYHRVFYPAAFWTIDPDEKKQIYGSPGRHITASCSEFPPEWTNGSFDVIIYNGVYGWGVDDQLTFELTLLEIRKLLALDGMLVFGFNSCKEYDPLSLAVTCSNYFSGFSPTALGGIAGITFENYMNHTYLFYKNHPK